MRFVRRWIGRCLAALAVILGLFLAPVVYVEFACAGPAEGPAYSPIITDPAWQRDESRTLTTYPEWHVVHAYDDYARILREGDPHDFAFLPAIAGFWTALCPLKTRADAMGGMSIDSKLTIYTVGVSFTAELLAKAAYEETLGRFTAWTRGAVRSPLDDVSAAQAARYAEFLQQTPWYRWDFATSTEELRRAATDVPRDRERLLALASENAVKSWYAELIAGAVAEIGADALRLRSVIDGVGAGELAIIDGVDVIEVGPHGVVIETDRYRAFTTVAERIALVGGDFGEIAGNDEILMTANSGAPQAKDALYSFRRQGYGDWRHLILLPVAGLAERLRGLDGLTLEHIHDY